MSNVFISHSSVDKPIVRKLAVSLLSEGIPVWLDSWQLEVGDSLLDKVYAGIEESAVVLLTVSKNSVESGWVNRELNAALAKEQQVGRRLVIPVKLDDCALPLKVADRFYADFSSGFSQPLKMLVDFLVRKHLRDGRVTPDKEVLPVSFTRKIHLDKHSFEKSINCIRSRQRSLSLNATQVVVDDDAEFLDLYRRLHTRIDNISTDRWYSPDLESYLRGVADGVQNLDRQMREGLSLIVNNGGSVEMAYWFAHLVRSQAVRRLWGCQPPGEESVKYGSDVPQAELSSNTSAAEYFGCSHVVSAVIYKDRSEVYKSDGFAFFIPDSEIKESLLSGEGRYMGPVSALDALNYTAFDRYVFPQVVCRAVRGACNSIPWSITDAMVALQ